MLLSLFNRYRFWRLKRKTTRILHGFDDRQLRDVGTFRDSIELFVDDHATIDARPDRTAPDRRVRKATIRLDTGKQVTS